MSERDEKFFQSATRLWDKMLGQYRCIDVSTGWTSELDPEDEEHKKYITMIAQWGYDLLVHDRLHTGTSDLQHAVSHLEAEQMVQGIPDMKEWPE